MSACKCCPDENTSRVELFNFYAPPQPYRQPTIQPGSTYDPRPLQDLTPAFGPFSTGLKWHRDIAYWWMTLLRTSYAPLIEYPFRALNALKPTSNIVFTPNGGSLTPGWFAGVYEDGVVIVISGTSNVVQAINYILTHASDRQGGQTWTVNKTWYDAAAAILPSVLPLVQPNNKFTFILGHSYGAAVAATLAALLPQSQLTDKCALVTAGSPAYGSDQFCQYMAAVKTLRIATVGDPVPYLPPPSIVGYAAGQTTPAFRLNVGAYKHCQQPTLLTNDGRYVYSSFEEQDPGVWFPAVAGFLTSNPLNMTGHRMAEYVRRARLAVPTMPGPFLSGWANFPDLFAVNDTLTASGF